MKKIIKLTEKDLSNIVRKVILEQGNMFGTAGTEIPGFDKKIRPRRDIDIPLYIRAAIEFIKRRKITLTEKDLSNDNIKRLSDIICEKANRLGSCNPSLWDGKDLKNHNNKNYLGYYDCSTEYSKSPSFKKESFTYGEQTESIKEIMLTLGQSHIESTGNGWVLTDDYNFDNILEKKPFLKTDKNYKIILNTIRGIGLSITGPILGKSPVYGIEEALSQIHNTGYPCYPVKINVPFNGCKCKS
jgi:hypothetical protein